MQPARILGHATATVKHSSLKGWRLLIAQPLDAVGNADGFPQLAIDELGSRRGDAVLLTSDSRMVREMMQSDNTPVRWAVLGVPDA